MTATLGKIVADFATTLNLKVAVWATSATLDSATDDDGVALPTWTYFLTIDRKSANKEYIKCTLTSTALTSIQNVSRQGALTSGFARTHRKWATVEITDFAIIKKMLDLLDGATDLNASVPLKYDWTATISNDNHLATKAYVDGVAIAGGADASTTTKGISKLSYAPVSASDPIAVGDNDPRVPTTGENDALAGTSGTAPSGTNKFVDNDDTSATAVANKVARFDANGRLPGQNSIEDSTFVAWEAITAGQAVFVEPVTPFASATLEQYVWDVTSNTRASFPIFWTGVSWTTIKLSVKKFVSPSATFSVRIETDNSGSPSGTLAHANAYGTVSAGSITTSFVDTTVTLNGSFTLTAWTRYHLVVFAGTYASETIDSTNFYAIWFSTNNSTTRFGKHWNGSTWTTGSGELVSESASFAEWGGGSEVTGYGYRILANTDCYITSVTISTNTTATRVRVFTDAGSVLWTATIVSKDATFSPAIPLTSWVYYRIESDNSWASYQSYNDGSATFPTGTNINFITWSADQSSFVGQRNITHVSTVAQNKYFFPYTSSALFQDFVLSLTDADYSYKIDWHGISSETKAVWEFPKITIGGINSNQSWLTPLTTYYLGNTPWAIASSAGTNSKKIGKSISATQIKIIDIPL